LVGGHLPPLPKTRIRGRERGIQISLASLGVVADGRAISWVDDGHRGAACRCLPLAIDQQGYIGVSWACCCHVHLLWWSRNNARQYEWRCSAGADFAVAARLRDRMLTMMAAEFFFGSHVRYGFAEETSDEGEVNQADQEPGDATDQRIQAQVGPQDAGHAGADQRQDEVMKYLAWRAILLFPEHEIGNHGQVDEGKGDQRAEVDHRGHQLQRWPHRQQ